MTKIEHTNIIIDNFSIAKSETNRIYTHILTHIHTDHLKGLHDGWTYGPIYCTKQTKALLLYKFPSIPNIITIPLQTPTEIKMSATLSVTVTFFDANHCIGGVIVLIEGYMGRVLYTGDMRFDREIYKKYSYLYPVDKLNQNFQACSKTIDILYVDNTFLKNKFNFPPKQTVLKMAVDYIQKILNQNKYKRIFIGLDSFGKEQVLVELATHFSIYQLIRQTPLDLELFTTNKHEGVVEVVRKDKLYSSLQEVPESIGVILSGWVNHPIYRFKQTVYCLPYSLHSNYDQIHQFVKSIRPSFIYPIVHQFPDQNRLFYAGKESIAKRDLMFNQKLFQEEKGDYKNQIKQLRYLYASPPTEEYKILSENVQLQKKIDEKLRPPNISNLFTSQKVTPLNMQVVERKKYKISNSRNQLQINRLKNQIKLKKKIIDGQPIQDIDRQSLELSDNSKDNSGIIDLDDQEQVQKMKEDVVEVDPLFKPINSKSQPWGVNFKRKNRNLMPLQRKSSKLQQKSTLQITRQRNRQSIQKAIQIYFKKQNNLKDQSIQNLDIQSNQQVFNLPIDLQKPINKPTQSQPQKQSAEQSLISIDEDEFRNIKIVETKEQTLRRLKRARVQLQLVRQSIKDQLKSDK